MRRPLVTAVVTTYDRPELAKRAIRSAIGQTYEPLEIIVVEDGSASGLEAWLGGLDDDRVTYRRHEENRGLAAARNTAIELAEGEYVAFLDDDDEWKPERIHRQVDQIERLDATELERLGVVYCAIEVRRDGRIVSVIPPVNEGSLQQAIVEDGASTLQSSCLFAADALEDIGGFDEELPSSIDHDLWMALATHGYHAHAIDEPLVVSYDEFDDSMMTDTARRIEGVRTFVEKWRPTYCEWLGPRRGERRAQRYFTRIIARLAAAKLVTGKYGEARIAIRAIRTESDEWLFPTLIIAQLVLEAAIKRFLPPRMVRTFSSVFHRLEGIHRGLHQ